MVNRYWEEEPRDHMTVAKRLSEEIRAAIDRIKKKRIRIHYNDIIT